MRCEKCVAELDPGEKFCGECGHPVNESTAPARPDDIVSAKTCAKCNAVVDAGKRFCSSCGYDLLGAIANPATPATVATMQAVTARTPASSSRMALVFGLVAVVGIFVLGMVGIGLWKWLGGRTRAANQNTPTPATRTANISGNWNCEFTAAGEIRRGQLVLVQNGSSIIGAAIDDSGTSQIDGTFDGQKFSFKVPKTTDEWQLTLSPDGSTMTGEAPDQSDKMLICRR